MQLGNQATHRQSFSKLLIVVHAMRIPSGAVRSRFHHGKHANTDNFPSGGSGADHCAEVNFTYGCPLPVDSIHLDLSDIAMGRLQGGGSLAAGVIPTRYKRIPCPVPGNVYIWLRDGGGPYYFALSVVNTYGVGSVTSVEIMGSGGTTWTALLHDPNYTSSRPQERYGSWTIPQGSGPFNVPIAMRITNPAGQQIVNMNAIKSFTAPATAPSGWNYIDLGVQFT